MEKERKEYRYYISSLTTAIETFRKAVRGRQSIGSMHWNLDVTFREDANTILDRQTAQKQNIIFFNTDAKQVEEDGTIHAFGVYFPRKA